MIGILPATLAVVESYRGGPMTKVVVADGSGALVVDYLVGDFARRPDVAEAWAERHVSAWNARGPLIAAGMASRDTFLMIDGASEGGTLKAIEEALTIAGVDLSRPVQKPPADRVVLTISYDVGRQNEWEVRIAAPPGTPLHDIIDRGFLALDFQRSAAGARPVRAGDQRLDHKRFTPPETGAVPLSDQPGSATGEIR